MPLTNVRISSWNVDVVRKHFTIPGGYAEPHIVFVDF